MVSRGEWRGLEAAGLKRMPMRVKGAGIFRWAENRLRNCEKIEKVETYGRETGLGLVVMERVRRLASRKGKIGNGL
jgi:hypothetical protein